MVRLIAWIQTKILLISGAIILVALIVVGLFWWPGWAITNNGLNSVGDTTAVPTVAPAIQPTSEPTAPPTREEPSPTTVVEPTVPAQPTAQSQSQSQSQSGLLATTQGIGFIDPLPYDCSIPPRSSWTDGKFLTHPRGSVNGQSVVMYTIDVGHLGSDVDVIVAIDVPGIVPFGGRKVYDGANATETRFVLILRTNIQYVQFKDVLGGDEFHIYRIADDGGDAELAKQAFCHAYNTARIHQVVYDVQDWGSFLRQFGKNELPMIKRLVLCQVPAMPELGIPECDFAR